MAYFIFKKNSDDIENTLYRIAENYSDLNNLNIIQSDYKIIEDSQTNFDAVKYGTKNVLKYNNDIIIYKIKETDPDGRVTKSFFNDTLDNENNVIVPAKENLNNYITYNKKIIKDFLDNNKNHPLFNIWNDYYNQLNTLNLDNITYPLEKSLEQYFKDQNKISLHTLQIP
jgi:hypothetical protein